jgi:flotillin
VAPTRGEEHAAPTAALKAQAEAEQQQAMQGIITVEETAKANREKGIAIIKSEEAAQQSRIAAEREAFKKKLEAETAAAAVKAQAEGEASAKKAQADGEVARAQGVARSQELQAQAAAKVVQIQVQAEADRIRISAEAKAKAAQQEAEATIALAEAIRKKGQAEGEAHQKMVEAENAVATKFLMRDIALKALEVMPAVTRELMQPAKAISEIKVLQLHGGMGGGANGDGSSNGNAMFGASSPILKTILEAGAAYPLLREMLSFAQVDTGKLADKVRAFVGSLPDEVKAAVDADPELQSKLAELTRRVQDTTMTPAPEPVVHFEEPAPAGE